MPEGISEEQTDLGEAERERGRAARWPFQIGWRGWYDILARVFERIGIDNLGLIAAGVTFYIFLALVPAMIAIVTLYGLVADNVTLSQHLDILAGYLPEQGLEWISRELTRITQTAQQGLTLTFIVSLGISFWSMNNAVVALFSAMNVAYGEVEKRTLVALYLETFAFTVVALFAGVVLINVFVIMPIILSAIGESTENYGGRSVTAPIMFIIVSLAASALFRFGPSRKNPRWKWLSFGSAMVASGWLLTSTLLSWYLSNVANYTATYGSLGAIMGLLFWIFASVYILCLGAELNAEIEHQTLVDTTTGPPRPLGRRGAFVADTIGKKASSS